MLIIRYMNPRPDNGKDYIPTEIEHRANIYTHGVSILTMYKYIM